MSELDSSERWWQDAETDPIHVAAVEWWARLQEPDISVEETIAWQEWVNADPRHAQAFDRIEEVSQAVAAIRPPVATRRLARDRYDASMPLGAWLARVRSSHSLAIAASALIAACVLGWALFANGMSSWLGGQMFATDIGENRTVRLSDGSMMTLGGDTRVEVSLREHERRVELEHGEAFFTVAKDSARPFKVQAGSATVVAVGTEFNVRRGSDRAVVAVTEGRVVVEPSDSVIPLVLLRSFKPKLRTVRVDAGEQAVAGSAGIEDAIRMEDPAESTSWKTGRLAFRLQPLRYVLEDVNRYAPKPIVLADESVGSVVVTGTVTRNHIDGWLRSLERGFDLVADEKPDRIVLRKP